MSLNLLSPTVIAPPFQFRAAPYVMEDAGPVWDGVWAPGRIWGEIMANQAVRTLYMGANESLTFGFDFQNKGPVMAGETISIPVIPAVSGLVITTPPVVLGSDFVDGGDSGRTIPAGKGVKVRISGSPGTYSLYCKVTASGGDDLTIPGRLVITDNG